jgi:ribosomal-protein-alanine N-acetyltransferase
MDQVGSASLLVVGHHDDRYRAIVGKGEITYTALMTNVRLLPVDSDLADTLRMGSEQLRRDYGVRAAAESAPTLRGVVEQTLGMFPGVRCEADQWGGYLAVDETSTLIVGSCAFKGPPTTDGTVEIAYYTFGPYEGQGYAKSMARALISIARSSPVVRRVIAHTLPERNPSTSVLRSVGMRFVGDVWDPDDGLVWRWQLDSGD